MTKQQTRKHPHIQRKGRGWRARVKVGGKQHVGPVRTTQEKAYADAKNLLDNINRLPDRVLDLAGGRDLVINKTAEESTRGFYRSHFRSLIREYGEGFPLHRFTEDAIENYGKKKRKQGWKTGAINADLRTLNRCLRLAKKKKMLMDIPDVELLKVTKAEKRQKEDEIEPAEFVKMLQRIRSWRERAVKKDSDADVMEFMVNVGGLRRTETALLRIRDIDLTNRIVKIDGKSDDRIADIPDALVPVVKRLLMGRDKIPARRNDPLIHGGVDAIANIFKRWQERLNDPRLHAHALRYIYITALAEADVSITKISDLSGHKTLAMLRKYVQRTGSGREIVNRLRLTS